MYQCWRDGREAEGGGLENRFTFTRDGGSNPSPSATRLVALLLARGKPL